MRSSLSEMCMYVQPIGVTSEMIWTNVGGLREWSTTNGRTHPVSMFSVSSYALD